MIKVTADAGNGWWYGYVVESFEQLNEVPKDQGFFPSNYVERMVSIDEQQKSKPEETEGAGQQYTQEEQVFDPHKDQDYSSYAKTSYADRNQVIYPR